MDSIFKRTGGEDFPDKLKVMISGSPKSGKTSMIGTVPNIVIADTEPHANNLQSIAHRNIPYTTINSSQDLQQLRFVLADPSLRAKAAEQLGMPDIEAVGIDTLDSLQQVLKVERMREMRQTQFMRDDWAWIKDEMVQIVRAFTSLPLHVFFAVHVKTSEIGRGDDSRTVVLPGLQGSIAEEIAGLVGYSLFSFRVEQMQADGSRRTVYRLRTEGDETYTFLGNRAAGRLDDVIEPTFQALYEAAMSGRPEPSPAAVSVPAASTDVEASPVQQHAAQPAVTAQTSGQSAMPPTDGQEPVNATALTHVAKIYAAIGAIFPEDQVRKLTLEEARGIVRMWKAFQQDDVEGKNTSGMSAADEMCHWLFDAEWLDPRDAVRVERERAQAESMAAALSAAESEPKPDLSTQSGEPSAEPAEAGAEAKTVSPDPNGNIEQVIAWVETGPATRVQNAYDVEIAKPRARGRLLAALVTRGAVAPVLEVPALPAPAAREAAPLAQSAPEGQVEAALEPSADEAAQQVAEQAAEVVTSTLGGTLIGEQSEDGTPAPCEECGQPVDDEDIAVLSRSRFKRWLCVTHYIAETKRPRVA